MEGLGKAALSQTDGGHASISDLGSKLALVTLMLPCRHDHTKGSEKAQSRAHFRALLPGARAMLVPSACRRACARPRFRLPLRGTHPAPRFLVSDRGEEEGRGDPRKVQDAGSAPPGEGSIGSFLPLLPSIARVNSNVAVRSNTVLSSKICMYIYIYT